MSSGEIESLSPIDGHVVGRFGWSLARTEEAIARAREAQPAWEDTPLAERIAAMMRVKEALRARKEDLARLLTLEIGKPLWEARTEVDACINKVDVTVGPGLDLVAPVKLPEGGASYAFRPHGVVAVIGPFNFPLHLVNGHVIPALVTGNTVLVKPSELAPAVTELYAEVLHAAGIPAGVFQVVQGDGRVGQLLSAHADVNAVLFTGSHAVGSAIERAASAVPGKLVALEMGGRNPAIVLADAHLEKAVHDVLWGAFVTSGQRCSGTGLCLVESSLHDGFVDMLRRKAARMRLGDPRENDVFMGPVVSTRARDNVAAAVARARAHGAEVLWEGRLEGLPAQGAYVAPTIHGASASDAHSEYLAEELFGPDLAVVPVDGLEQAITIANGFEYGLSASVFTQDTAKFDLAQRRLRYGNVNLDAPTCGASSKLPFGGLRKSGNHRPAALFSTLYCTYTVSTLVGPPRIEPGKVSPGMGFFDA